MSKFVDETGNVYGSLRVIRRAGNKYGLTHWECVCKCGNTHITSANRLRKGETTRCTECYNASRRTGRDQSRLTTYRTNAANRGYTWSLSNEEFYGLTKEDCFYCTAKPDPRNGIDRFDNGEGYTLENSVPCCSKCNMMKHNLDIGDFLSQVVRIHSNIDFTL